MGSSIRSDRAMPKKLPSEASAEIPDPLSAAVEGEKRVSEAADLRARILETVGTAELDEYVKFLSQPTKDALAQEEALRGGLERLLAEFARTVVKQITWRVVKNLRQQPSGTSLNSAWEDVCVQVQSIESMFWPLYIDVIEGFVSSELAKLTPYELRALWLQTEAAEEWIYDEVADHSAIPNVDDEIARYVVNEILAYAENYTNQTIREFLD
jgi:hypothetical protein